MWKIILIRDDTVKAIIWKIWVDLSLQVNRPISMKKEGIQTRKRRPKNSASGVSASTSGLQRVGEFISLIYFDVFC